MEVLSKFGKSRKSLPLFGIISELFRGKYFWEMHFVGLFREMCGE